MSIKKNYNKQTNFYYAYEATYARDDSKYEIMYIYESTIIIDTKCFIKEQPKETTTYQRRWH